ncbi:hypothetical protein HZ326_6392 [Fusarium oxysporum f. sp. albedinis]|nr:hypothetical protein HZ326_6392 [Fusarium oxysporum f. sp. albedinis]
MRHDTFIGHPVEIRMEEWAIGAQDNGFWFFLGGYYSQLLRLVTIHDSHNIYLCKLKLKTQQFIMVFLKSNSVSRIKQRLNYLYVHIFGIG